ncbi:MAG: peptide chain release factor N(5)-glutamine methyltransferase [Mongoliibacter sp.]|uniref:peptide chain release factor N(5)-glutamine methyltransferase n=1 Tax=Mongoliibacter sp. TaxID=2022438 RepID=UPI0012F3C2E1|nr:peptide chain release factor N(5)-glutamine methyltransferase [Mongoliibacter sp.]TVP44509.1 MAG: peptide chain release factor N(5)-glutamine methyltransferase [Mongoliibacter sp.]
MRSREIFTSFSEKLIPLYGKNEAESLSLWLLEDFLGIRRKDLLENIEVVFIPEELEKALEALLEGKPIQYITGKAPFYGREFEVNPAVLIPRNETEELVHLIIKENKKVSLRILDIGTGSGCIPITLQLEILGSKVYGVDISETALELAQKNADLLGAFVTFQKLDILTEEIPFQDLDIVVSNPPYVRHSEKSLMHRNVLDHEPHLALFVYDDDPLLFYRTIAGKAKKVLKPGGKLYFEINEAFGEETLKLMEDQGFTQVELHKDLNGRNRILVGRK